MSVVISVRIPKKLKEEMDKLDVVWSEEIRKFLEMRVNELKKKKKLEEVKRILQGLPESPKSVATTLVREDRDSR
ncbi:hypothetical protein IPA_07650 [Ignicoccus pacificus DSM 13166]|uniref:VapB-type antitoxin n=1 Tax=Ignicoccus pacificus DSM 13166 TaxID=940294 RepID=A0A977KA18_9CREN|nr:hypothetical protein IPA_07650 [Ignicoccus pacificus DSM 13166]